LFNQYFANNKFTSFSQAFLFYKMISEVIIGEMFFLSEIQMHNPNEKKSPFE
jgi:hypothetical protein